MDCRYSLGGGGGASIYLMTGTAKFVRKSDFNQLVTVSGLFVEGTQLKPVVGKFFVCRC